MGTPSRENGKENLPKGFVRILVEECKGCGVCVEACPQDALRLSEKLNRQGRRYAVQPDAGGCTGCSLCYIQCPSSAIVVYRRLRQIRAKKKV